MSQQRLSSEGMFYLKLGKVMLPGEVALLAEKHTVAFCFGEDDVACLRVDETVDKEIADELIFRIDQFLHNSYMLSKERAASGSRAKSP